MSRCDHKPRYDAPQTGKGRFGALSALQWQSLALAMKEAGKFRPALKVGPDQAFDFAVHVRGMVTVCEDNVAHVTKKPDLAEVLGVVLLKLGPKTRASVIAEIEQLFGPGADEYKPPAEAVELAENLLLRISTKEPQTRSGNVTGKVEVEVV